MVLQKEPAAWALSWFVKAMQGHPAFCRQPGGCPCPGDVPEVQVGLPDGHAPVKRLMQVLLWACAPWALSLLPAPLPAGLCPVDLEQDSDAYQLTPCAQQAQQPLRQQVLVTWADAAAWQMDPLTMTPHQHDQRCLHVEADVYEWWAEKALRPWPGLSGRAQNCHG